MPEVSGISSSFYFDSDFTCMNSCFQYLSWLIIERGLISTNDLFSITTNKDLFRPIEDYLDPRRLDLAAHPE